MNARLPARTDFEAVYADHFPFVWRCLRALGIPDVALDDAAQDVFVVVHRRLPEFRGESSLRTWLYGVVRNVAANQRRSERRKPAGGTLRDDLECARPAPDEQLQDREAAAFVQAFVAELSDKKRDVFVLALLEQMSIPEVAAALGIPVNTAYTRLRDVRLEFQRALERKRGES